MERQMMRQSLSGRVKVAIALAVLAGLSFLAAALIIFIRKGDWPARYISAGVTILAVTFIAVRRLTSHRR
jgi:hypothetical protein